MTDLDCNYVELERKNREAAAAREPVMGGDGSVKKNTAFCRKLKNSISVEQLPALIKELQSLKQERYLDEIVASICEAKLPKGSDVWAAVEIVSVLHQRYEEFASLVTASLLKLLGPPPSLAGLSPEAKEREEANRLGRQKTALRLVSELNIVGVSKDPPGSAGIVPSLLKTLLMNDKEFLNVSLAASFARNFSASFLLSSSSTDSPFASLIPASVRESCTAVISDYFKLVSKYLIRMHKHVKKIEQSNSEHAINRGEISEERQERYLKSVKTYEKLLGLLKNIAAGLSAEMPELPEDQETVSSIGIISGGASARDIKDGGAQGPWEDEETRLFYEELPDLKLFVPTVLLGEKHEAAGSLVSNDAEAEKFDAQMASLEQSIDDYSAQIDEEKDADEVDVKDGPTQGEDASGSGPKSAAIEDIFNRLPNALSRDLIDHLAVEFCFLNTKSSRKRLIKHLVNVPRQRLDLLPCFSRFVAILMPYIPEISTSVVQQLQHEFLRQQKRRDKAFLDEKLKVIRFLGELTKFKVAPVHVPFHALKVLLADFTNHNIEICCALLETCGRYLFKTPETNSRMVSLLDTMIRKKSIQHVDQRQSLLIENAYFQCNPPASKAISVKERSPLELYFRKLFYSDLSRKNVEKILKQLRKASWEDIETLKILKKLFRKCWKVKFANIHLVAFLASELSRFYNEFGIFVVDQCLEDIRVELEFNLFKHNQRRIAAVRYLGELYNYRLVDSTTIFDTLYLLVRFGYENAVPEPGVSSPLDASYDFFRARLVCTLLDTCGQCFDRGTLARKLDEFLCFFQVYLASKDPLPRDVNYLVIDTFELLRPKMIVGLSYDESVEEFNNVLLKYGSDKNQTADAAAVSSDAEDDVDTTARIDLELPDEEDAEDIGSDDSDEDELQDEEEESNDDIEEEEVILRPRGVEEPSPSDVLADEAFEKEFNRTMIDSLESRKFERKSTALDIPIGFATKLKAPSTQMTHNDEKQGGSEVPFTVLLKKGNKQQAKSVFVPNNSPIVHSTRIKQVAEQEEKRHLKRLVLSYEERERDGSSARRPVVGGIQRIFKKSQSGPSIGDFPPLS